MSRTWPGGRCRVVECSPTFQVRGKIFHAIEEITMMKVLSRIVFGLWIVGAPMMLVGCGEETKKESAPVTPAPAPADKDKAK
jgi:hypothetical protein